MEDEKEFSEHESLALITQMINKAKCDYEDTGVAALMWGIIITFCSLVTFANYWWHQPWADWIWVLTFFAVIPQIIISSKESKRKKYKAYHDDVMGGIWISFGITIFLFSYYTFKFSVPSPATIFLILYGIPTFATGISRHFMPMTIGGIAAWIFAIISMYIPLPYPMLLTAATAQVAWFIPGLILRARYLKAKQQHV